MYDVRQKDGNGGACAQIFLKTQTLDADERSAILPDRLTSQQTARCGRYFNTV